MRRWQKRESTVSHVDDWLMTYADMITLLLCFFAVLMSVAVPKITEKAEIAPPTEQAAPVSKILEGNLPLFGRAQADEVADRVADRVPRTPDLTVPVAIVPIDEVAEPKPYEPMPVVAMPPTLPEIVPPASDIATKQVDTLPDIVDHLKTQGPANIEQKGDRITTIDISSAAFFARGSATLSDAGKGVLRAVARNIKSEKFRGYQVTVEGHTDDAPIKTLQFPSNWELSTARASAVVHYFLEQGVPAQRLRAAGYADTFPKAPNRDASGNPIPANQARNRRVVIKLEKIDREEQ